MNKQAKPDNCTCDYPTVIFKNVSGHAPFCSVHKELMRRMGADGLHAPLENSRSNDDSAIPRHSKMGLQWRRLAL